VAQQQSNSIQELFSKIGPVLKFKLLYDRAGRSEGIAFVTYEDRRDAQQAIRDYDGANANGNALLPVL
jgi:THO complex subunit 4